MNNNELLDRNSELVTILRAIYSGRATKEQLQYYKEHYLTEEEKQMGKARFEMTDHEKKQYEVLSYNNSIGTLTGYNCPKCKNRGDFLHINDSGYTFRNYCSCMTIRDTLGNIKQSGLGNLLDVFTFDKYECRFDWQKDAYSKAKEFINSDKSAFIMLGASGSGKSMLCTAVARELMLQGMELKYMMWRDDSTKIKQCIASDPSKYNKLVTELKYADILYIDDFFKGENNTPPSPADISLANEIINYRYFKSKSETNKRYVTLVSCERTLQQLIQFDEALAGRLYEMSKPNYLIQILGKDKNYRFM